MKKFKSVLAMSLASTLLLSGINPIPVSADDTQPVELTGIEDGAYTNSSAVTISGRNGDGVQKIVAGKNGALNTYEKSSYTIEDEFDENDGSLVESSDGYWVVKVYGNDGSCDSANFTIDKHAPEVNYLSKGEKEVRGTNTKQKDYTVVQKNEKTYLVTFKDDNLDCVQVVNDANWNAKYGASGKIDVNSSSFSWSIKGAINKTVTCKAWDMAGNVTTVKVQFSTKTGPTFKSPVKNGLVTNKGFKIHTDTEAKIRVDGAKWSGDGIFNKEGKHTITAVGKWGSTTAKVILDYTKPSTFIRSNARLKAGKVTLTKRSYTDKLSGIDVKNTVLKKGNTTINSIKESKVIEHKDGSRETIWYFKKYKLTDTGSYTLTLKDKAGNKRTVKFKVVK